MLVLLLISGNPGPSCQFAGLNSCSLTNSTVPILLGQFCQPVFANTRSLAIFLIPFGNHTTNIDRGGWENIDEIIQEKDSGWMSTVNYSEHRKETRYVIIYDKDNKRNQPTLDILMFHRTWLIALIIDNELWNWGRNKKKMEFHGARLHPDITVAGLGDPSQ